jgi:hypothetical protein
MIYRSGAGPEPVPYKDLTEENLADSIIQALKPDIQFSVKEMSENIAGENGSVDAAASFHNSLNLDNMRCMLCPDHVAMWGVKNTSLRLSSLATAILVDNGLLTLHQLKLYSSTSQHLCVY